MVTLGHNGTGFAFDNEGPAAKVFLAPFALSSRTITNAEYLAFVEAGGYERPEFWLSDGWNKVRAEGWHHPLYWEHHDKQWFTHTLNGFLPLDLNEPVCHVSHYEADAYARFAAARLPTEFEWEFAASGAEVSGNFVESTPLLCGPGPFAAVRGLTTLVQARCGTGDGIALLRLVEAVFDFLTTNGVPAAQAAETLWLDYTRSGRSERPPGFLAAHLGMPEKPAGTARVRSRQERRTAAPAAGARNHE